MTPFERAKVEQIFYRLLKDKTSRSPIVGGMTQCLNSKPITSADKSEQGNKILKGYDTLTSSSEDHLGAVLDELPILKTRFESDILLKQGGLLLPTGMPVSNMFRATRSKRLITESPRFDAIRESVYMQPILEIVNNA